MAKEYETKVIDIDVSAVQKQLLSLGATKTKEVLMRRWVFDLYKDHPEFIRLRDDGVNITLTYKSKAISATIGDTEEIEVQVEDFEKTYAIISKISFSRVLYQENKRISYIWNSIEFDIDIWPKINPYLEIEADSLEKVQQGLAVLGLKDKDSGDLDVQILYKNIGIDLNSIEILKFEDSVD